jgi:hypothetical protein
MSTLRVHIDRLILDGLPVARGEGPLVQAAVAAELSRLFTEGGLAPEWRSGGAVPSLPAGSIALTGGDGPAALGERIARAVYGGIGT